MNKKVIYVLIALVVIIVIAVAVYFLITQNQQENGENDANNVNIDLQALNTTLSSQTPFNEMATMDITMDILNSTYQITADEVEAVIGKMPMMNVQASMYLVIQAKDGAVDSVKTKVDNYATSYEQQWERYLPEQYELVKQRKTGVKGNYVYLIISENAAELEALIK